MAKVKEAPEDLQRQKEDIENLLSSLETAFKEGTITQEHYNEVRQKNAEKLEETKKKLQQAERQVQKEAEKEAKEPPKETEPAKKPEEKAEGRRLKTEGVVDAFQPSTPSGQKEEEKKPGPPDEERLKEKIMMELSPKMEKINVRMVKLKAFVDALKEDKTGERESSQRLTEEVGEARSAMNSVESRLSEIELKLEDVSETLADLKPQRFAKDLQKKEEELKLHEAQLEKLDDMNSTILKRVNQIQIILEKLGNIESIATMTKDISKKMVSIDEREKKITRLADKIDSMFVEINKRLEEFMFYKAKQDSLDDLSKEMLKSMDEFSTKLMRYAEKDDIELLRDTLENKISAMGKERSLSAASSQSRQDKSEIESLMKLLDEQFKKGLMTKKDYEKAKEANLKRLKEMEGAAQIPAAAPAQPPSEEPAETPAEPREEQPETEQVPEGSGLAQAAKMAQPPPKQAKQATQEEKPATKKEENAEGRRLKTEGVVDAFQPSTPSGQNATEKPKIKPRKAKEPDNTISISKDELAKKIASPKPQDKKQKMLADLEDSFRKGLISQKAYESTQRIIMSRRI